MLVVIFNNHFYRVEHSHKARGNGVQMLTHAKFKQIIVDHAVGSPCDTDFRTEIADGFRRVPAAAQSGNSRHAGVVPAAHEIVLHQVNEFALGKHDMGKV